MATHSALEAAAAAMTMVRPSRRFLLTAGVAHEVKKTS
jgi:hypothetical protein